MAYHIYEVTGLGTRSRIDTKPSYVEAEAAVRERFNIAFLEPDRDFPGCADFLTANGGVGCIQPADFRI